MANDYLFIFRGGQFLTESHPFFEDVLGDELDLDDAFKKHRFYASQHFGDNDGVSFTLYSSCGSDHLEWLVQFQTAVEACYVICQNWIDLIALLNKLSPIVIAGVIQRDKDGEAFFAVGSKDRKEF